MAYAHGLYFKSRFSRVFLRSHLHDININTPKISIQSYCTQDLGPILCRAKFKIIHSFQQNWKIFVLDDKYLIPTTGYKWGGRHNAKTGPFYFHIQIFFWFGYLTSIYKTQPLWQTIPCYQPCWILNVGKNGRLVSYIHFAEPTMDIF